MESLRPDVASVATLERLADERRRGKRRVVWCADGTASVPVLQQQVAKMNDMRFMRKSVWGFSKIQLLVTKDWGILAS